MLFTTDPAAPQPVIRTATQNGSGNVGGGSGQGFANSIRNLTVDIGSGNAGAVGIDYLSNNNGTLRDLIIKSSDANKVGAAGISMKRAWPGPSHLKNIAITGFDFGIDIQHWEYSQTLENVSLSGQKVAGIRNAENVLTVRNLQSDNNVPAIWGTSDQGVVVLLESNLSGGTGGNSAVQVANGSGLTVRNLTTSGYASAIKYGGSVVAGAAQAQWVSHAVQHQFEAPERTMGLSVEEAPSFSDENTANWAIVDGSQSDDTAAIQAAMNSGQNTVCFPNGTKYIVSGTITVPSTVRRIIGLVSGIEAKGALLTTGRAVFSFIGDGEAVTFERFAMYPFGDTHPFFWFEQAGTRPLVLANLLIWGGNGYRNTAKGGKVFLEDVCGKAGWNFTGQKVWARQFNPESPPAPRLILNQGGQMWVLGLKTEFWSTAIETTSGGSTEVLGGLIYPARPLPEAPPPPIFILRDSRGSFSFTETGNKNFPIHVRETRDGETRDQLRSTNHAMGLPRGGKTMPLYSSL